MAQLVNIGFPCHTMTVRPGLRSYVHRVTTGHTCNTLIKVTFYLGDSLLIECLAQTFSRAA
jgi:hypothetical protein